MQSRNREVCVSYLCDPPNPELSQHRLVQAVASDNGGWEFIRLDNYPPLLVAPSVVFRSRLLS